MRYLKYLFIVYCLCALPQAWAAVVKVDFDVEVTTSTFADFDTGEVTETNYPKPFLGTFTFQYDTSKTEQSLFDNTHTFYNTGVKGTGAIKSVFTDFCCIEYAIQFNQKETSNSGEFTSDILMGNFGYLTFGIFNNLNVKGLGLENFFYSALAEGYEFRFGIDTYPRMWSGNAVITNVSTVPLPDGFWLFLAGMIMLTLLGQFKARRSAFSVSPLMFKY